MSLNANNVPSNGSKMKAPILEPGSYLARVVQVIGLGLQKQDPYRGQEKPPAHKIRVVYELSDEFMEDEDGEIIEDRPRWIDETFPLYSLDADMAKSTKRYATIDPDLKHGGDWAKLVGYPVNLIIGSKVSKNTKKEYNHIINTSAVRAKEVAKMPDLVNDPKVFDPGDPDMEIFFSLPKWLQDIIKEGVEYEGSDLEKLVEAGPPSDEGKEQEKKERASKPKNKPSEDTENDEEGEEEEEEKW